MFVSESQTTTQVKLIYHKKESGVTHLIILSENKRQGFPISENTCYLLSPDASFIALSYDENPISVYDTTTGNLIYELAPSSQHSRCSIRWENDTVLSLIDTSQNLLKVIRSVDISIGEEIELVQPTQQNIINIPSVSGDDILSVSPNQKLVVYAFCRIDDKRCGEEQLILYDVEEQQTKMVFVDTDRYSFDLGFDGYLFTVGLGWSPSGRYFTYRVKSGFNSQENPLRVYDTQTGQYIPSIPQQIDYRLDWVNGIRWLDGETKLAFWLENPLNMYQKRLAVFTLITNDLFISPQKLEYWGGNNQWSMGINQETIVFINPNAELMEMDISTGSTVVLDTQVDFVWIAHEFPRR